MHALYSPCTRRMGLHQIHIGMTGTMNSLALYSLTQYIGLRPILFNAQNQRGGWGGWEGGITCWVAHVHARRQRERPNLCSYSYMRLNGSELVECWVLEYKGLAPDTMPGRCSTCDSIQMHTGVGIQ